MGFLSLTPWISVLAGGFRIYGIGGRWRQTGIGKIGWHTLRHSFATALDVAGARMKVAQELMRHANIATTMDVYTGVAEREKRETAARVAKSFLGRVQ
ncbi:MAG: tyrosine-type recombinase/integrase [Acidobacteria bacterium]|nr:tyrosine-type recombinase/integrase [Acidobacteriota bacterium]